MMASTTIQNQIVQLIKTSPSFASIGDNVAQSDCVLAVNYYDQMEKAKLNLAQTNANFPHSPHAKNTFLQRFNAQYQTAESGLLTLDAKYQVSFPRP